MLKNFIELFEKIGDDLDSNENPTNILQGNVIISYVKLSTLPRGRNVL